MKNKYFQLAIVCILLFGTVFISSCKEDDEDINTGAIPTVTTATVSNITSLTAICGGTVVNDGGNPVTERGVCWSTTQNPTISNNKATDGSTGTGNFVSNIFGLTGATTYYVRAYATNNVGTAYGNEVSFTTQSTSDFAYTLAATDVRFNRATLNGIINPNGIPTEVFFEYGTTTSYGSEVAYSQNPCTGQDTITVSRNLTGLAPITTYHYRIKTINYQGTSFGQDMTFKTNYLPGDSTNGGVIFYVDQTGEHGLVVATTDHGESISWNNGSNIFTNAVGIDIGSGVSNTQNIVNVQGSGNYAAWICYNLSYNGYNDWVLPSVDELEMADTHASLPSYSYYWSSTEVDSSTAILVRITNLSYFSSLNCNKSATWGSGNIVGETIPISVRAIRAF